ncbi:lipoamide acyltransferase component of branched-chain alpha-keto acid dehydrogenase complex [Hepatocystis sp. ex Piliocolobus tephrosceles]|uniref:Dihydrolipoamide acetyltransferase component of pyruvate dehydrogenase complex n=1 Tax=Piliocolobus tephrosceles TaxID=591936 RepID=A0A8C9G732_9PRIM|nr:lipoamide acyltransferase component of branched-chain alpha-keto acid dehydrogenase complex [Hepatocystis sp. ex Piliocolobus tephrosceles]
MINKNMSNILKRIFVLRNNTYRNKYIHTSGINFKIVKCKLFDIGEGISEVEITQWNKQEGDQVLEMESILTVQSDKAAVDITSKYSGVLVKKYYNEKDMLKVGSYFCEIDTTDEVTDSGDGEENKNVEEIKKKELKKEKMEKSNDNIPKSTLKIDNSIKASPGVKKKALRLNINLNSVAEHLNKKIISMEDIDYYIKLKESEKIDDKKSNESDMIENYENLDIIEQVELKGIQLAMCKSMNNSINIPMFHVNESYNVNNLINIRNDINSEIEKKENIKISITSILLKLISNTLKEFPKLNSKFNQKKNTYTMFKNHNICIAIDTPNGLLVPNIKNVNKKNIVEIQKDLLNLREKAIDMKLSKSDIEDGTITVSNVGSIGGVFATPIIFDHQACIIGISRIQKQLFLKDQSNELKTLDDIIVANTMSLTYGADHRFLDGATVALYGTKLKNVIEGLNTLDPYAVEF